MQKDKVGEENNPNTNSTPTAGVPIILIDNNMIQYFLNRDVSAQMEPFLLEIESTGAILAVSQIVVYEALKAIVFDNTKVQKVSDFFEKYLLRYQINEELLVEAARVHEMYGSNKNTKKHRDSFSTEDIIIATTAMLNGAYILTCDANDFPIPFFKEINRQTVYYEVNDRRRHITIYLLQPDAEVITAALQ